LFQARNPGAQFPNFADQVLQLALLGLRLIPHGVLLVPLLMSTLSGNPSRFGRSTPEENSENVAVRDCGSPGVIDSILQRCLKLGPALVEDVSIYA